MNNLLVGSACLIVGFFAGIVFSAFRLNRLGIRLKGETGGVTATIRLPPRGDSRAARDAQP
jgi:hypothetical protein